jgi:TonB family protein
MLANANSQTNTTHFTRQVREVMAICTQNNVPIGKPDNLADFLQALNSNKHLAMNFWAMVARCEKDRTNAADPDWLLNAIVEGVTGRTVAELDEAGPNATLMGVRLSSILAGEDVSLTPFPPGPARELEDPAEAGRWARTSVPAQVTPIAPHTPPPEPTPSRRPDPVEPITNPAWLNDRSVRLVLQPEPEASDPEQPISIPLSSYADHNPQRTVSPFWLSAALLAALLVGGFWFVMHRNPAALSTMSASIRSGYTSVTSAWNHTRSPQPTAPPNSSLPASATTDAPTAGTAATPLPTPTVPQSAPAPAPGATAALPPAVSAARSEPNPTPAPTPGTAADNDASEAAATSASETDARVVVPETLMHQNLLSSRVPIYPDSARGAKGLVVMHAVVTSDGRVEALRVLQGDPELRNAAMDAASAWRYRPYLLNGKPVDVSTTISVDFSPSRAPLPSQPIPMSK